MVESQKTKLIAIKHYKKNRGISLSIEEKDNYENNLKDNMDLD